MSGKCGLISVSLSLFLIVAIYLCALNGYFENGRMRMPVSIPIKLEKSGLIADFEFEIAKHEYYVFILKFPFQDGDHATRLRLQKLLGTGARDANQHVDSGISIPIRLTISSKKEGNEKLLYFEEKNPAFYLYGEKSYKKKIVDCILLPGTYRARLENRESLAEFSGIPVYFLIVKPSKITLSEMEANKRRSRCIS